MRLALKFATLQLCLGAAFLAQTANARPRNGSDLPLLSPEQGQALADFVLRSGPHVHPKPDCSHLVHALYSRAGLNYTYQGSRQLHQGAPEFVRVRVPQPGDLVVWLGHAGIVLSPEDTTFLSSVRSGIITESWTNDYWSARGRPRFFRYIVGPQADLTVLADLNPRRTRRVAPVEETRITSEPLRPPVSSSDDRKSPSDVATIRQHSKPDKQDIAAAFFQGSMDHARQLLNGAVLGRDDPVSIVEHAEVKQIKIRHDEGLVRLQLIEALVLDHGTVTPGATVERELILTRRDGVWVMSDPNQRLYLLREQAVDVLEDQLRLMLQSDSASRDRRALIRALNLLYDRGPVGSASAEARKR